MTFPDLEITLLKLGFPSFPKLWDSWFFKGGKIKYEIA